MGLPFAWVVRGAQERVDRFAKFPEEDRRWQVILSDFNLRGSSLWSHIPQPTEGIALPTSRIQSRIILVTRSLELLGYDPSLLSELTPDERNFADLLMAGETFRLNLSGSGAMERLRARKKQVATTSHPEKDVVNEVPPPPSPAAGKSQKAKKKRPSPADSSDWFADKIGLSFPSSASAHSDFGPHLEEVHKLLWPEDKDRFDQLGPQSSLSATASYVFQVSLV